MPLRQNGCASALDDNLRKINVVDGNILTGNQPVARVHSSKSLGVYIDDRLSWSAYQDKLITLLAYYQDYICKNVSSALARKHHLYEH